MKSRRYVSSLEASQMTAPVDQRSDKDIDQANIEAARRMGHYRATQGQKRPGRYFQSRYQWALEEGFQAARLEMVS